MSRHSISLLLSLSITLSVGIGTYLYYSDRLDPGEVGAILFLGFPGVIVVFGFIYLIVSGIVGRSEAVTDDSPRKISSAKTLRKVFIGAALVANVLLIGGVFYVISNGHIKSKFEKNNTTLAKDFITDFSASWDVSDVDKILRKEFHEGIKSPNGQKSLKHFHKLGSLQEVIEITLKQFSKKYQMPDGRYQVGVFYFKAKFENAEAVGSITIVQNHKESKILGVVINPTSEIKNINKIKA